MGGVQSVIMPAAMHHRTLIIAHRRHRVFPETPPRHVHGIEEQSGEQSRSRHQGCGTQWEIDYRMQQEQQQTDPGRCTDRAEARGLHSCQHVPACPAKQAPSSHHCAYSLCA
jgi:hypothetical protein